VKSWRTSKVGTGKERERKRDWERVVVEKENKNMRRISKLRERVKCEAEEGIKEK
jgi:hypothetical protein